MKVALGVLVLILATACSGKNGEPAHSSSRGPTPSDKSATASPTEPRDSPRQRLRDAQLALSRAKGGAYYLTVGPLNGGEPLVTEAGRFAILDDVLELVRTMQRRPPGGGASAPLVMRVRSSADRKFLQMDAWGTWEGCWLDLSKGFRSPLGVDLSEIPNIPVPAFLILHAGLRPPTRPAMAPPGGTPTIAPASGTPAEDTITVYTNGLTALQMFGVAGSALFELDPAVARAKVPVSLAFFERQPNIVEEVTIDGPEAAAALRASNADLDRRLLALVRSSLSVATFYPDPNPVRAWSPAPAKRLPDRATRDQTCPANLD